MKPQASQPAPVNSAAPVTVAKAPVVASKKPPIVPTVNPDAINPWDQSIAGNTHNVRALCDLAGLDLAAKNLITACIDIESGFQNYYIGTTNPVLHHNILNGVIESTDWGIVQCNDKAHIGPGKDYPSTAYVLDNPEKLVNWMITMYKAGRISMWNSYLDLRAGDEKLVAAKWSIDITKI